MKRVKLSYVFAFLTWGLLGSATAAKQPNFIFILADDMPWYGTAVQM